MKSRLLLSILSLINLSVGAQQIDNVRFEQEGKIINIYYDLTGDNADEKYTIEVYCSTDGGTTWGQPLIKVTGNVGANQTTGKNKRIVWDVLAEREKLQGDVVFEVRVNITDLYTGTFTDARDGHVYKWVKIGEQVWMGENLAWLPTISPPSQESNNSPCYYVYGYKGGSVSQAKATGYYTTYGVLYNWTAAMQSCPGGWHLPADAEWTELIDYLDGEKSAGGKLKESGTEHWRNPNTGTTNESGFSALPGGYRLSNGNFDDVGDNGLWWSATGNDATSAWDRGVYYNSVDVYRNHSGEEYGFGVRCVRDY